MNTIEKPYVEKEHNKNILDKCWRQPIPTNLLEYCYGHKLAMTILMLLLLRASNKDGMRYIKGRPVFLERGQGVYGREELSEYISFSKKKHIQTTRTVIKYLISTKRITKRKTKNGTIFTILNYDKLVQLTERTTERQPNANQTETTNKSDKSNKNDKNVKKENFKILHDGTKARLHFGQWVDYHDSNVKMDISYYPELTK